MLVEGQDERGEIKRDTVEAKAIIVKKKKAREIVQVNTTSF